MLELLWCQFGKALLTLVEVATVLGVSLDGVKELVSKGKLQVMNAMTEPMVSLQVLADFMCATPTKSSTTVEIANIQSYTTTPEWEINVVEDGIDMAGGSVSYVKSTARWLVQLDLGKTPDGKRIRKSKSFKSEDEARNALAVELAKLHPDGIPEEVSIKTYAELVDEFFKVKRTTATDRTWDTYRDFSKYSVMHLGNIPIDKISKQEVIVMFNKLKTTYKDTTLHKTKISAGLIFDYAIDKGYINGNPIKAVKKLPKSDVDAEEGLDPNKALCDKDLTLVLSRAKEDDSMDGMISLLAFTGMRPGELRGLKVFDINVENETVRISRAASYSKVYDKDGKAIGRREYIKDTKNGVYAHREIKVPREILEIALRQHQRMVDDSKYKGDKNTPFLFPSRDGGFFKESAFSSRWQRFRDSNELDKNTFWPYVFRHTMCTNLMKAGQPIKNVQKIMGDNTLDIVIGTYTHVTQNDMDKSIAEIHTQYLNLFGNKESTDANMVN